MRHIPYTYLIGWSDQNIYYYGVRYAKGCDPSDLFTSYFTSSKVVKEYRSKYGEPDIIQIRKTFNSSQDAIDWESKVLRRMTVTIREDFLNRSDNKAIFYSKHPMLGKQHNEYTKKKISESLTGKKHSEETKSKMRESAPKHKSKKHRAKISSSVSGSNNGMFGKTPWNKGKERDKSPCQHCGKMADAANMKRWHGDNCKELDKFLPS